MSVLTLGCFLIFSRLLLKPKTLCNCGKMIKIMFAWTQVRLLEKNVLNCTIEFLPILLER